MECTVQLRGGKLLAVDVSGNVVKYLDGIKFLLNGDNVQINETGVLFLRRKAQYAIGVVSGFKGGVLLDYPAHPYFQTVTQIHTRVRVGDRILIHLDEGGGVHYVTCFPNSAAADLACAEGLYNLVDTSTLFCGGVAGAPRYTGAHRDLSHLHTFTVDPESSVDLDDAISLDIAARQIYVHIVDIHTAIPVGSPLEETMFRHGATLYLAEQTKHLLPPEIVRRISLDCGERREAITIQMTIDASGAVVAYEIYPSTIVVKQRFSYTSFGSVKDSAPYSMLREFTEAHVETLPLNIPSLELNVDSTGVIQHINRFHSNDIEHRMIACAMIAANFTVSAHLEALGVTLPNRFHEAPTGLFQSDVVAVTGNMIVDSFLSVKKWRPARYDLHAKGHFGLGLSKYVHFTSPMRRYPDVLIHRVLAGVGYDISALSCMVDAINTRALLVRHVQKYYTTVKVARHLVDTQALKTVYVTGVNVAGLSWYSPEYLVNGFTHVSKIGTGIRWGFDGTCLRSGDSWIRVGSTLNVTSLTYNYANGVYNTVLSL